MCSENSAWRPSPAPAIARFAAPAELEPVRAVWVTLDGLRLADPHRPATIGDGLDFAGRSRGVLHEWRRGARGEWFGVVTYGVGYADGRARIAVFRRQLVPAHALRPRADNDPVG